jgi:hypothetical protein
VSAIASLITVSGVRYFGDTVRDTVFLTVSHGTQ